MDLLWPCPASSQLALHIGTIVVSHLGSHINLVILCVALAIYDCLQLCHAWSLHSLMTQLSCGTIRLMGVVVSWSLIYVLLGVIDACLFSHNFFMSGFGMAAFAWIATSGIAVATALWFCLEPSP